MTRIGFFGEAMLEGLEYAQATLTFGGDTLNSALYLARLAQQPAFVHARIAVHYFTAVGQDQVSKQLLKAWQQEGINTAGCQQLPDKTVGRYQIMLDAEGERRFCYQRSDSAARCYFRAPVTELERQLQQRQLDWLYISGISLAILPELDRKRLYLVLQAFVAAGGKLVYDNNFRPQLWSATDAWYWQQQLLPLCQLALLTDSDELAMAGLSAEQSRAVALAAGVRLVLVKQGANPCLVGLAAARTTSLNNSTHPDQIAASACCWQVEAEPVRQVVDSSAAGDSFAAGVLAGLLNGSATPEPGLIDAAIRCGHRLAAAVLQQHGAIILPSQMPDFTASLTPSAFTSPAPGDPLR
jgi:2-dehydro-3-deoxygluconokinase